MERQETMVRDLTVGRVVPLLLRFSLPLFVSNALQAVYNVVDMVVVGNCIGKAGMSAVSIGGEALHLLTFVAMGFSSAGQRSWKKRSIFRLKDCIWPSIYGYCKVMVMLSTATSVPGKICRALSMNSSGSSMDRSTWLSAAKWTTASGFSASKMA